MCGAGGIVWRPLLAGVFFAFGLFLSFAGSGCAFSPGCSGLPLSRVPDEQILASTREALDSLAREKQLDERTTVWQVDVAVAGGQVTLTGKSSSRQLKDEAVALLGRLPGVRRVADAVVVLPDPSLGENTRAIVRFPVVNLGDAPGQAEGKHTVTQAVLGMVVCWSRRRGGIGSGCGTVTWAGWMASPWCWQVLPRWRSSWREGGWW